MSDRAAMTILPKKKEGEESDSDSEGSGEASPSPPTRPPLPTGTHVGPPDDSGGAFLPSSDSYYHRYYTCMYVCMLVCICLCVCISALD